jgi:Lhr-like helicase
MSADDAERRIRELEEELRRAKQLAEWHKEAAYELVRREFPYEPLTDEEIQRLLTDRSGTPVLDIIAEYERELR